jgi:hypothetical protein
MAFQPIDDDQTIAGEGLSAWLPNTLRDDIDDCATDRHVGCGFGYSSESNVIPTVSTPSFQWRNLWTRYAPVYRGAQTMTVRVRYEAAIGSAIAGTDAIEIRLSVGGRAGSATTLTVTSAATDVDVSAPIPSTGGTVIPWAVQVRSLRAAASFASVTIYDVRAERYALTDVTSGSLSGGVSHCELVIASTGAGNVNAMNVAHHVPLISATGGAGGSPAAYELGLHLWPHTDGAALVGDGENKLAGSGDVYDVGTITPVSYSVRLSGSLPSLAESVGLAQVSSLRPARAISMIRMARAARDIYGARVRWWASGPRGDLGTSSGGAYWTGYRATAGDVVRAALCEVRQDASGFTVGMLWRPVPALTEADDITITVRVRADDGSELDAFTASVPGDIIPEAGPVLPATQPGPAPTRSLAYYNVDGSSASLWGARDLPEAGEELPLIGGLRSFVRSYPWPSGASAGDDVLIEVEIDTAAHVWECMIAERIG